MKNLTPEHMRCPWADCPSIHELEDGRLLIIGERAATYLSGLEDGDRSYTINGDKPVRDDEEAIVISPDLLSEYVKEAGMGYDQNYRTGKAGSMVQTPSPQAESLSGHQDFKAKAAEIVSTFKGVGPFVMLTPDRAALEALIASALSSAVAEEREACAKLSDFHAKTAEATGKIHPEDTPNRDRCFARAREARLVAASIRNRGASVTEPLPQGPFEPEAPRKPVQPVLSLEASTPPETPLSPASGSKPEA